MAEGFAAVPTWMIRDTTVSARAILVYASLASRSGLRANIPSQETLGREARCTGKPLREALRELEALGVVERVRRTTKNGYRQTDGYRLLSRPLSEDESLSGDIPVRDEPNGSFDHTHPGVSPDGVLYIEADSSEVDNPQTPTGGQGMSTAVHALTESEDLFAAAFHSFYSIYPRKVGKEAARKAYAKAARRAGGFVSINAGARRFAQDPNLPQDRQFIPYPATWLNRDGWEDEPLPPRAGSQSGTAMERMARQLRGTDPGEVRRELGA